MKITLNAAATLSGLLKELSRDFPDNIPINNDIDLLQIRRMQGNQEVIQWIRNLLESDEETEDKDDDLCVFSSTE